jgi:hypothetical protein
MDHPAYSILELEVILKHLDEEDALGATDKFHLLDEVRFSDLRKMNDANLQGRLDYYLREYTFEMNPRHRREFHREVVRTKIELRRRVLEKRHMATEVALAELQTDRHPT